jgi:hypothetical protein
MEARMKKVTAFFFVLILVFGALMYGQESVLAEKKVLFVYDEVNKNSSPYIEYFRNAFGAAGIGYDEAAAADANKMNLNDYRAVVIYGMVMAFNGKSPVRDWLKASPDLQGRKVSLLVTANRWFLKDLNRDLTNLLNKNEADVVDAVSTATKSLNDRDKEALVQAQVSRLK